MFKEVDEKYSYTENDLGAVYSPDHTMFKVWSPLADDATVLLYKTCTDEKPYRRMPMEKNRKGVWFKKAHGDLNGVYYTYEIRHDDIIEETIDIYAKSAGTNGIMGMVLDMESTNPAGWGHYRLPEMKSYADAVIYELHVRDFSIDSSGHFCYKGRFLAFVEKGLVNASGDKIGIDHLKELGVTHVQLMPCFDYQTVDEEQIHKPQFNWGYDPMNFNVPEGSYSTNPADGKARVGEFKRLIHALHSQGIRVIMDVVYNHTYAAADSCFNKTFPGYYYRHWDNSAVNFSNASGCGNEIATERPMVRKYILDSLMFWATEYKIDGFRFDLMGIYDIETINMAEKMLHELNPDIILYGEGWTGGDSPLDDSLRCMKLNARRTPNVGYFSDDFRDTIKGNNFEDRSKGYINGTTGDEDYVREVMCGRIPHPQIPNLKKFSWAISPCQTVNYVEAHDNLTLWDKIRYTNPTDSIENRIQMDKMAAACVFLAQGIPFIQAGQEFLRSKPLPGGTYDHNSYHSPDVINSLKWDRKSDFYDVFEYYKGLISFRKAHSALRMATQDKVSQHMMFYDHLPQRIVGFGYTGDSELDEISVFMNPTAYPVTLHAFGEYDVYVDGKDAGTKPLYTVCDDYDIASYSVMVIGKSHSKPEPPTSADDT